MTQDVWQDGPPPEMDDGSPVLVILKADSAHEYYGGPVVVSRWSSKLKTTIDPIRLEYDNVLRWCEVPVSVHDH